ALRMSHGGTTSLLGSRASVVQIFAAPGRTCGTLAARSLQLRFAAGEAPERLDVTVARAAHDLGGQLGRLRLVIPAGFVEPVAHVLLVERRRLFAWMPVSGVPVARGIRSQHLVD